MKAINHKSVLKGYLLFSVCMVVTVLIFVFMSFCFVSTYTIEASKIESRSNVFDKTFAIQVNIVERMDSLYNYMKLINSDIRINNTVVQNTVSARKMLLLGDLEKMNEEDVLLYKKLINEVNRFLMVKDSIEIVSKEEETVRGDLLRCISADRQVVRRLSLEGINR